MKSLLKMKRLPGILAVALVALAVGAAGAPATAAPANASGGAASGLNKKQKKKKHRALKKCKKKHNKKKRKKCKKHVKKKYKKIARKNKKKHKKKQSPKGATKVVGVYDDYFAPSRIDVKVNDSVKWQWQASTVNTHNVTLIDGPKGVDTRKFVSADSAGPTYSFKRTFTTPGEYHFVCTLHAGMTVDVKVSK